MPLKYAATNDRGRARRRGAETSQVVPWGGAARYGSYPLVHAGAAITVNGYPPEAVGVRSPAVGFCA